jgi:hypothetical protein
MGRRVTIPGVAAKIEARAKRVHAAVIAAAGVSRAPRQIQ